MSFPSTWYECSILLDSSDISITFPTEEYASIAKQVLEVDPELSPERVDREFEVQSNLFIT